LETIAAPLQKNKQPCGLKGVKFLFLLFRVCRKSIICIAEHSISYYTKEKIHIGNLWCTKDAQVAYISKFKALFKMFGFDQSSKIWENFGYSLVIFHAIGKNKATKA
jgi:hypothetical protein